MADEEFRLDRSTSQEVGGTMKWLATDGQKSFVVTVPVDLVQRLRRQHRALSDWGGQKWKPVEIIEVAARRAYQADTGRFEIALTDRDFADPIHQNGT